MKSNIYVHHYHHQPKPRAKKKEGFFKSTSKIIGKELFKIGDTALNEAVNVGDDALHAALLTKAQRGNKR